MISLFNDEEKQAALEYLRVVGLDDRWKDRADKLSGGQQQRVCIARSLMQNPELLLADEPVASLDPSTSHSVMDYLARVNREFNKTIVCNLHFLSLVREYATRVIALKDGEMVFSGSPLDIDEAWYKRIYGEDAREIDIR